jgi:glycosyltransferase involved in cell wall biosynthesis
MTDAARRRPAEARPSLLVLTRIWPSARRPSLGVFVRARVNGVADLRVVRPRWPGAPSLVVYAVLLLDALLVGRRIRGVEAHMLIPTGFIGLVVARLFRVPLVVYAHGGDVRGLDARPWPIRRLARLVARHADRLLTNSEDTARWIRRLGGRPQVAPPGIDVGRFRPTPRPIDRRVLYLGGRSRRKGYAVAVELADTLVGPWLREVDPDEVPALIAAHDVVLVPSVAEPFGLVAVEAIASGRWVVASAVGGLPDIVRDGVNGTLVADGDFAGALARVPDYDPTSVASTAEPFSVERWQATLAATWDEVAPLDA